MNRKIPQNFRSGYAALTGRPNAGKSTLLNQFLKYKLSIVTKKPQTTRRNVLGILTGDDHQVIFMDTPGLISPGYTLQKMMMKYLDDAVKDADVLLYLVDVSGAEKDLKSLPENLAGPKPLIIVLNKIDLIPKNKLLPLMDQFQKYPAQALIPVSALKGDGVDLLLREIILRLPLSPPYFPPEYVTNLDERFFVSEIIREKIFKSYGEEIPYAVHVQVEEFRENPSRKDYIRALIFVERQSQKGILIGKQGGALKRIGEESRREIESFLQRPIFLELFVKVMDDWRKRDRSLRNLGY
ncbi:MAG: GTPase Era [Calditrichia bacterium]